MSQIVLAFVFAVVAFIPLRGTSLDPFLLTIEVTSTQTGVVQVFFDIGRGIREEDSVRLAHVDGQHRYVFPLPAGTYRSLRIDPGTEPGRYAIGDVTVLEPDGRFKKDVPLAEVAAVQQLTVVDRAADRLVVDCLPGMNDPQLQYLPAESFALGRSALATDGPLVRFLFLWILAVGGVGLLRRTLRSVSRRAGLAFQRIDRVAAGRPRRALAAVAMLTTLVATYPLVFLGRSLVSPNNSEEHLLYFEAPFTPESSDTTIEDVRGSDVSAALLAFVPNTVVEREAIAGGEAPLWNRYNAAGRPLWGQGQAFMLDPLHWFALITPDLALGWDLKYVAHRFVFTLGVGLVGLAVTGAWLPAAVATAAAPFVGLYVYRLNHPAAFTLTYAPWVLLALALLGQARGRRSGARAVGLLAVTVSLVLCASPPKEAMVMLLGLGSTGVVALSSAAGTMKVRVSRLLGAALAGAAALLLTAPQWLVFLDTLRLSRTLYDVPFAEFGGRRDVVGLVLGPLLPGQVVPGLHTLALVLVIAACVRPKALLKRPLALAALVLSAALLSVAFGAVSAHVLIRIPLIGNIGHVTDAFVTAATPLLLVVSACGALVLLSSNWRGATVIAAATGLVGWWLTSQAGVSPAETTAAWPAAVVLALATMFPFCVRQAERSRAPVTALLSGGAAALILVAAGGLHVESPVPALDSVLAQPRPRVPLQGISSAVKALSQLTAEPARTAGIDWSLFAGSQALYDLEGLGGPDALQVPAYEELINASGMWRSVWVTRVTVPDVARLGPLLDMLNVGYFVVRSDYAIPEFGDIPLTPPDRVRIGRRATAWPRAFFTDGVVTYGNADELIARAAQIRRPFAGIQASDTEAMAATWKLPATPGTITPAEGYKLTANATTFRLRTSSAGLVVLTETYLPRDFHVTLNGRPVPYFRANHAFKAVVVPEAGEWEVRFEYRPARWGLSWWLAAVGAGLLVGVAWFARRGSYAEAGDASE